MRDLSNQVPGLSISSMSAGNTVSDDASIAQTAPGSRSVLPVTDATDVLPQPEPGPKRDFMRDEQGHLHDRPGEGGADRSPHGGSEGGHGWTDVTASRW